MSMSTPTPTPTPLPQQLDEVTQPSAASPGLTDSGETMAKRIELTSTQWEAEALVTAEEAEARASSAPVSGALRYAAARMLSDRVGDSAAAIEHLTVAVATPPGATFAPVLRALRLHALEVGSVWSALDQLDVEITASAMVAERASRLVEKAYLLEDRLLASEPARAVIEQALGLVAGHRGALAAAQAIAERGQGGDDALTYLRTVLERRLAAASSPAERARVLTRLALLAENEPERLAEALVLFGRGLDEDAAGDAAFVARSGLRRAAARLEREVELMRGFTLEAAALEAGPSRAVWLGQAAALARHRLGAAERATDLVGQALADEPDDVALLAVACEDHLAAGRWAPALALLDHQAELTSDRDWAAALWGIAGHIAERRLGDDQAAVARFRRAREVNPSNPSTLAALERIASRTGDTKTQVQLAVAAVGRAEDPAERAALAVRAAEINESAVHDIEAAIGMARQALEAVPGYPPAVHLLERLYPMLERWDDMLGLVDADADASTAAALSDDDVAGRRLERLGLLQEERLGDPGAAMALFSEWALLGPRRPAALRALLRAAEKAGDALVAAEAALKLGTDVPGFTEDVQVAWRYRAATIFEERAAADTEAIRAYESALALAPGFRPALAGLARAHERRKSFEALAAVLSRRAEFETNPAHASVLEVEAAHIESENLGRSEAALETLGRALSFDTTNLGAVDYYVRMLQRLARGDELEAALGTLAEKLSDPVAKAAIYRRQAEVFEWQLRRPREALAAIERSLAVISANRARPAGIAGAEAVQERLYLMVGRLGEALALGASHLAASGPPAPVGKGASEVNNEKLRRRIDLALRATDAEPAANQLARIFEDPAVLEAKSGPERGPPRLALEAYVAALRRLGREREAGFALEQLASASTDPETRVALWRAAIAARERLGEAGLAALPLWERVVEASPEIDALAVFERLATAKGDTARVVLARRTLAEHAPDPLTRSVFLWELGLAHADAGDLRGAAADFERALEAGSADEVFLPALRALARLREHTGELRGAAELWIREARQTKLVERATRAFRHAARLYANSIRDERSAAECLESVVTLDPDAEVDFQVLSVILRHQHQEERLLQIMRRRAAEGTPEQRRDRLLQLADLLHERNSPEAVEALAAAVELDPSSGAALVRLAEMLAETGRSAEAVATFRRAIGVSPDAKLVSSAWIRIGDIAAADLGDVGLSVDAYRNALLSSADDIRALGGLLRGLLQQRDYANAALISRRLGTVDPDRDARVGHWISLGELLAGAGEDPEGSAEAFEQALELAPQHDHAIDHLDALLVQLDEPARLAAALGRYLAVAPQSTSRRMRLASLLSGPLSLPNRAVDELRLVITSTPDHVPARAELARVLEESGRLPEAILEHLGLLRLVPLRLESLRALRRLFERSGERARTARATAVLAALGAIDAVEIRAVREARTHYAAEPGGSITAADFDMFIRHPDEHHPATALLAAMVEVLPRFYVVNIEDWGVTKADRLGPRSEDPIRAFVHRVAGVFGITEPFDIYLARSGTPQVQIEATQPPALLVPATLLGLPRQEALLQLGRQLGRLRAGTYPAARIPPKDLGLLVAAGVRTMFPDYARGALPEDKLNELSQKIARALPRRHRRAFEQAALSFRDGGVFDADRWRIGLSHTAYRAAILISSDVLGAFERIARGDRRLAAAASLPSDELVKAARANPEVVDMINFALGEELAGLERRLGGN